MQTIIICAHPDDELLGCFNHATDSNVFILGKGRGDKLDNQFDKKPLLFWIKKVEEIIEKEKPKNILTHYEHDLNIDHRIVYQAVMTATRYKKINIVSFEVNSSTELSSIPFNPNVFESVDPKKKWEALVTKYRSEMRDDPHPRSKEKIFAQASYRGMQAGLEYAEAYKLVRLIA